MKNILLLTDVDFWREGAGRRIRILELVKYISSYTNLTIAFIGLANKDNKVSLSIQLNCNFIFLEEDCILEPEQYGTRLERLFKITKFESCIIEYIHNSFYLQFFPENINIILDTHDIISDRTESFKKSQYASPLYEMSKDVEFQIFDIYDYIIAICEPDFHKLKEVIPEHKLLLCSHPSLTFRKETQSIARNISFIGSYYSPNKDAIEYFVKECWPAISTKYDVNLNIYGDVAKFLNEFLGKRIYLKGYIENIYNIYSESDIIINPVRLGAGIKIKNIEAMGYGLPLITTSHGARGIEKARNLAFLVADDALSFIECVSNLLENYQLRTKLSIEANKFISENFSPAKCFQSLVDVLNI